MKEKLRLDLDALRVDTFVAQERPTARGTVNAHDEVNDSTLPACGSGPVAPCTAGCGSDNASCQTACMTTPCCPYTVTCPPTYACTP